MPIAGARPKALLSICGWEMLPTDILLLPFFWFRSTGLHLISSRPPRLGRQVEATSFMGALRRVQVKMFEQPRPAQLRWCAPILSPKEDVHSRNLLTECLKQLLASLAVFQLQFFRYICFVVKGSRNEIWKSFRLCLSQYFRSTSPGALEAIST